MKHQLHLLLSILFIFVSLQGMAEPLQHFPQVPNSEMTPGELCSPDNPHFDGYRYQERIPYCKRKVTPGKKRYIYGRYQIPSECRRRYTIDHLIPLSIGGDNSDQNLWPEHVLLKQERPDFEQWIFDQLREGDITQAEAVAMILEEKTRQTPVRPLAPGIVDPCDQPSQSRFLDPSILILL